MNKEELLKEKAKIERQLKNADPEQVAFIEKKLKKVESQLEEAEPKEEKKEDKKEYKTSPSWDEMSVPERLDLLLDKVGKQSTPVSIEAYSKKTYNFLPKNIKDLINNKTPKESKKEPIQTDDECRELLKAAEEKAKAQRDRAKEREKAGKPAVLTIDETLEKTADVIENKVETLKEDGEKITSTEFKKFEKQITSIAREVKAVSKNDDYKEFIKSLITKLQKLI